MKRNKLKSLLLLLFTFALSQAFTQPRVITFDSKQEEAEPKLETNSIKLHPFEFLTGDYSLYYEKALLNNLSAEIGLGFTFGYNVGLTDSDNSTAPIFVDGVLGHSFTGAIRFYPSEVFEDFYIAAEYKYRKFNWEYEIEDDPYSQQYKSTKVKENRIHSMPRLTFGYIIYFFSALTIDMHLGLGVDVQTESLYSKETMQNESYSLNARPRVNAGIKIGYVF